MKDVQIASFRRVLHALKSRPRFITVHSRGAEDEVLAQLREFEVHPVVLHWFTGSATSCETAIADGHWFSVNAAMLQSERGRRIIRRIPRERILCESDYPHVRVAGKRIGPLDTLETTDELGKLWGMTGDETEAVLRTALERLLAGVAR